MKNGGSFHSYVSLPGRVASPSCFLSLFSWALRGLISRPWRQVVPTFTEMMGLPQKFWPSLSTEMSCQTDFSARAKKNIEKFS